MRGQLRLLGGRKLHSPLGLGTRPTTALVREALINIVQNKVKGCHWLDLFSGSGVIGCEALQRGAYRVVAVEQDKKAINVCKKNLITTASALPQRTSVEVIKHEVIRWLSKGGQRNSAKRNISPDLSQFDIVYLDPPYESNLYSLSFECLLKGNWLKKNSIVICEHSTEIKVSPPNGWLVKGHRSYGKSALLLISPPESPLCGIDSMHSQTNQPE